VPHADAQLAAAVRLESALRQPAGLDALPLHVCVIPCAVCKRAVSTPCLSSRSCVSWPT
jgi:hypothetical protein